uniref:Calponin-homology (CH) domain-containing protein n=1 Tax=Rhabditophanes sp. KR3021 TaxID=114890 RepID=A0AC35TK66_9BILA
MNVVKKIRRDKSTATKCRFTFKCTELFLQHATKWPAEPKAVVCVAIEHGNRMYQCSNRTIDPGQVDLSRGLIAWPDSLVDPVRFETTFYRDRKTNEFCDKKWVIVVYEILNRNKKKALAACPLNMRHFLDQRYEINLKLKPLDSFLETGYLKLQIEPKILDGSTSTEGDRNSVLSFGSSRQNSVAEELERIPIAIESSAKISQKEEIKIGSNEVIKEYSQKPIEVKSAPSITIMKPSPPQPTLEPIEVINNPIQPPIQDTVILRNEKVNVIAPVEEDVKCEVKYVENEELNAWTRRVIESYRSKDGSKLPKDLKSGVVLCAIIHAYRPDLIGNFDDIHFYNRSDGQKANVLKGYSAGEVLNVKRLITEVVWVSGVEQGKMKEYLANLKYALQKDANQISDDSIDAISTLKKRKSDHRFSDIFKHSDSELQLIDNFNEAQRKNKESQKISEIKNSDDFKFTRSDSNGSKKKKNLAGDINLYKISSNGQDQKEKAKKMLEQAALLATELDDDDKRAKYQQEVRNLLSQASDSSPSAATLPSNKLNRTGSIRSTTGSFGGSQTDLRKLSLNQTDMTFRKFNKVIPSPNVTRKAISDTPIIPACARPSRKSSVNGSIENISKNVYKPYPRSQSQSRYSSQSSINNDVESNGIFDNIERMKRYGSMRGQELAGSFSSFLSKNSITNLTNFPTIAPSHLFSQGTPGSEIRRLSPHETPTRKLKNKWEIDLANPNKASTEQHIIQERVNDIQKLKDQLNSKLPTLQKSSTEESQFIQQKLAYAEEIETLMLKLDYYNSLANLRETNESIIKIQKSIELVGASIAEYKCDEKSNEEAKLIKELKTLMNEKDSTTTIIMDILGRLEEPSENNSLTLESNFQRGNENTISRSRRIINWISK